MPMFKSLAKALEKRIEARALKLALKGSTLPAELFDLTELRELYLDAPELTTLPTLLPFSQLTHLEMSAPTLDGDLAPLFALKRLQVLKLHHTPLRTLPLGHSTAPLRFLTLKACGLKNLPPEFGELLQELEELSLASNELKELPGSFRELRKLKRLNLDANRLEIFPTVLGEMKNLKHLSLDHNLFSQDERERIQREYHLTPV